VLQLEPQLPCGDIPALTVKAQFRSAALSPSPFPPSHCRVHAGHDVTVFGEGDRYHFSQHDLTSPPTDVAATALAFQAEGHCLNTLQFSCHDAGWESPPGNYFFIQGSRAQVRKRAACGVL
jgi:hypothetical protein